MEEEDTPHGVLTTEAGFSLPGLLFRARLRLAAGALLLASSPPGPAGGGGMLGAVREKPRPGARRRREGAAAAGVRPPVPLILFISLKI